MSGILAIGGGFLGLCFLVSGILVAVAKQRTYPKAYWGGECTKKKFSMGPPAGWQKVRYPGGTPYVCSSCFEHRKAA